MPGRLRNLVALQVTLGVASLVIAVTRLGDHPSPELWLVLVAVGLLAAGDLPLVHVRFGRDRSSYTCSEAAMVAGLVLLPAPWLPLVAAAGALILHGGMKRSPVKVAYNAASFATAGLLVWWTFDLIEHKPGTPHMDDVRAWAALSAAGLVAAGWTALTVTLAVAFSQHLSVQKVFSEAYGVRILVSLANIIAALLMAYLVRQYPWTVLVVPAIIAVLLLTYRSYMRALQERDSWQAMQSAARAFTTIDEDAVATAVVERAMSLFRADHVELLIADAAGLVPTTIVEASAAGTTRSASGETDPFWPRAWSEREPFQVETPAAPATQRSELEAHGLGACAVAPLVAGHVCVGMLRLGFERRLRLTRRELQLFSTYADVVSAALRNAQLYAEVSSEREKLGRIVNSTSDGIFSVDAAGRAMSWNPAMTTMTGVAAEDALGYTCRFMRGDHRSPLVLDGEWLQDVLGDRRHAETSVAVVRPDGTHGWLSLSVSAVRDRVTETEAAVVVVRDITAAREAEQAKQDFLATVSHELRTPITSLKGWVVTLLRPEFQPSDEERADIHRRLLHQTTRLQRLIEDLLSVSSLEHGEFTVEKMAVRVDDLVDKTLSDMRLQTPNRPIEHVRAGLASFAIGDPVRIEQVVANLVSNADKYSDSGLPITVTVRRDATMVLVSVRDHGPGIPAESREAVFDRFTRLGGVQGNHAGGTGLGLHIARRLVEAMDGRIWVDDAAGGGAEFCFTLPAAPLVASQDRPTEVRLVG